MEIPKTMVIYTHADKDLFGDVISVDHSTVLLFVAPFFDFGLVPGVVSSPLAAMKLMDNGPTDDWRFASALLVADLVGVRHSGVYVYGHFLGVPLIHDWGESETVEQVQLSCYATCGEFDFAKAPRPFKGDIISAEVIVQQAIRKKMEELGVVPDAVSNVHLYN